MAKRTAIVVGATGFTGQHLVKQLCESEEYVAVTIIARRNITYTHAKLDVKIREFDTLEERDLEIADDLFCCLGTTMKKAKTRENFEKVDLEYPLRIASLAKKRGIPNFHVISAAGSSSKSPFFYSRTKGRMEQELIDLKLPHLSIFRPSLLTGGRTEFRLGERLAEGIFQLINPILVGPFKGLRAIEGKQLAFAMYHFAVHNHKNNVQLYKAIDILGAKPWEVEEEIPVAREELFDWSKRKDIFVEENKPKD
ncbi:NAD-dependent epimerase/dehydratase family protein [Psychrobacillus lasiicapitis]|uniref:NAD-dependent epimerase/dehydratase family protein n=1 Tax=Psychrobacillus lasiicapitis TaxID=1636719 RepID=UPI001476EF6F|nr:NAD(P)H-binding protein [Psychrobacillus lasiicapitis]GGA22037.1 oxidoreductase [Psychrobacillus lasiicapitis]